MLRVRVESDAGTACTIADHLRGPFAVDGAVGDRSCDLDLLLDAGLYKARLRSPDKGKGKGRLIVAPFSDIQPAVRLDERTSFSVSLKRGQQASAWMRIEKKTATTIEVAGRTAGHVALWRDGTWIEELPARHEEPSPRQGKGIHRWRIDATLEPGDYQLVVYGTKAKPWTKGPESDAVFITRGAIPGSGARAQAFTIPEHGFLQLETPDPNAAAFIELDARPSDPVSLRLDPIQADNTRAAGPSCSITPDQAIASCGITSRGSRDDGRHLIEINGPPGATGRVTWGRYADWRGEGYWSTGGQVGLNVSPGRYAVSAPALPMSIDGPPLACALDEYTDNGNFIRRVAIDAPKVSWTTPFERSFNYDARSTAVWLQIEKPGVYQIKGEDKTKASCEVFRIDGLDRSRVGEGKDGVCDSTQPLGAGLYEVRFYGGRPGIQKLRVAQVGLGAVKATTPAKSSCAFEDVALSGPQVRLTTPNDGGATLRGLFVRGIPSGLGASLPVVIDPQDPVTIPLASGAAIVVRARADAKMKCTIAGAPLPMSGGVCRSGPIASATTLVVSSDDPAPVMAVIAREQPTAAVQTLPRFDPQALKLQTISADRPVYLDFDRGQSRSMLINVDAPGLYDLQTEGLLATSCRLRTPTVGRLSEATQNGRGRNCLLQAYLKPGTYLFTATTQGMSKGRAAVALKKRPPRAIGNVVPGDDTFFRVDAGELVQQTIDVKKSGPHILDATAQNAEIKCRLDDHDGWPIVAVPASCRGTYELESGRYLLTELPLTVESRRRTSLIVPKPPLVLSGDKTHTIAINETFTAQLGKDGKDAFAFTLAAPLEIGVTLDRGMQGRIYKVEGKKRSIIDTVPPVGGGGPSVGAAEEGEEGEEYVEGEEGGEEYGEEHGEEYGEYEEEHQDDDYGEQRRLQEEAQRARVAAEMAKATLPQELTGLSGKVIALAAGSYVLETEHSRGDVGITYTVRVGARALAPGITLDAPVPGKISVIVPASAEARSGLVRIKSRGDVDVRCRLFDANNQLVVANNGSGADWNCAFAEPLSAGQYTLIVEAETLKPGATKLSAQFLEAKDTGELKDGDQFRVVAKVASAPLPQGDANIVHDVYLTSDTDFSCAAQNDSGALVNTQSGVRDCRLLLWPGEDKRNFRVFVWTPDRSAGVKASYKKRKVTGFSGGSLDDDEVGRARIDTRGSYVTGPDAWCRAANERGGPLRPCRDRASFVAGEALFAGRSVALKESIASLNQASTVKRTVTSTRAWERQRSKDKSLHLVHVIAPLGSSATPACRIEGGMSVRGDATCAAVSAPTDESTFAVWTRDGSRVDAEIVRLAMPFPSRSERLATGTSTIATGRFALPSDGFRLQIALPTDGWAVLLDGTGNPRDLCAPPREARAMNACVLRGSGGEAVIMAKSARVDLMVLGGAVASTTLSGVREVKPLAPGRERMAVAASPVGRRVRVEGSGVKACAIHFDSGAHVAGCNAYMPPGQAAEVTVEHDERAWRAFTYVGDRFAEGRFGPLPSAVARAPAPTGAAVQLAGSHVERSISLAGASAVRVRASSGVCGVVVGDRVAGAEGLGGGCDMVRLLPKGTHRVMVRAFGGTALSGAMTVSSEPVIVLDEGVGPELVAQPGEARMLQLTLKDDGEIGIGIQTDADALECSLFDDAQGYVGDGCHQFHALKKGTYALRIKAPPEGPPRRFKPVVFGLKGSAIDVPDEYLRDFFARIKRAEVSR